MASQVAVSRAPQQHGTASEVAKHQLCTWQPFTIEPCDTANVASTNLLCCCRRPANRAGQAWAQGHDCGSQVGSAPVDGVACPPASPLMPVPHCTSCWPAHLEAWPLGAQAMLLCTSVSVPAGRSQATAGQPASCRPSAATPTPSAAGRQCMPASAPLMAASIVPSIAALRHSYSRPAPLLCSHGQSANVH